MPEPISSSSPNVSQSSSADYDPTLDEGGQICRADSAPNPPPAAPPFDVRTPSVTKLMSAVPPAPSALPPRSTANNNAERTSERSGIAPYAALGATGDGRGVYAGVALLKGHDAKSGLDVEVLSASGQNGLASEEEEQLALVRVGGASSNGAASAEALTVRVSRGFHNDDGSTGLNLGTVATAVGAEGTLGGGANSVTGGLAVGSGGAMSLGVRDKDGDGKHEICAKISIGFITAGACVETPL